MAVYHFTWHAYRSWSPRHRRGYTVKGKGYQPSDPERAEEYDLNARQDAVIFERIHQEVLILGCIDFCARRGWRLHIVATDPTHLHVVVSWIGYCAWNEATRRMKNILSLLLGRATKLKGKRWFVANGSRKRVVDRKHLDHLITTYLPDHRGICWAAGDAIPPDVYGILDPTGT